MKSTNELRCPRVVAWWRAGHGTRSNNFAEDWVNSIGAISFQGARILWGGGASSLTALVVSAHRLPPPPGGCLPPPIRGHAGHVHVDRGHREHWHHFGITAPSAPAISLRAGPAFGPRWATGFHVLAQTVGTSKSFGSVTGDGGCVELTSYM